MHSDLLRSAHGCLCVVCEWRANGINKNHRGQKSLYWINYFHLAESNKHTNRTASLKPQFTHSLTHTIYSGSRMRMGAERSSSHRLILIFMCLCIVERCNSYVLQSVAIIVTHLFQFLLLSGDILENHYRCHSPCLSGSLAPLLWTRVCVAGSGFGSGS